MVFDVRGLDSGFLIAQPPAFAPRERPVSTAAHPYQRNTPETSACRCLCCRGIERDPRYVDAALKRWCKYTGEPAIHAESGLDLEALAEMRQAEMEVTA